VIRLDLIAAVLCLVLLLTFVFFHRNR